MLGTQMKFYTKYLSHLKTIVILCNRAEILLCWVHFWISGAVSQGVTRKETIERYCSMLLLHQAFLSVWLSCVKRCLWLNASYMRKIKININFPDLYIRKTALWHFGGNRSTLSTIFVETISFMYIHIMLRDWLQGN